MRKEIEEISHRLAEGLQDLERVAQISEQKNNYLLQDRLFPWEPLSLDYGIPALVVFYSEMDAFFPNEKWKKIIKALVSKLVPLVQTRKHTNFSLFSGLAGVCFAIQIAALSNPIYQKLDQTLCFLLLDQIETYYVPSIEQLKRLALKPIPFQYDAITGIVAFISYFLQKKEIPRVETMIRKMLGYLCDLTVPNGSGAPGWLLSPSHEAYVRSLPEFLAEEHFSRYPKGFFETGMAHGISGCLAALSKALLKGIEVKGQIEGMSRISSWLIAIRDQMGFWPKRVGLNNSYISLNESSQAWSHGDPGIYHSLFLAAQALKDKPLEQKVLAGLARLGDSSRSLPMCYGRSGLLTVLHRTSIDHPEIEKQTAKLAEGILSEFSEDYPFGFKSDPPTNEEGETRWIDNPGLATGSIGIVLSLLFFTSKEFRPWLPIFQIN